MKMAHIGSLLLPSKRKSIKQQSKGKQTLKYKPYVEVLLASSGDEDTDPISKKNKVEATVYIYVKHPPTGNQIKGNRKTNVVSKVIQRGPFFHVIDDNIIPHFSWNLLMHSHAK